MEKYLPTTPAGKLVQLMEECNEVAQATAKILRFGDRVWEGRWNSEILELELLDLMLAADEVGKWIRSTTPNERVKPLCP